MGRRLRSGSAGRAGLLRPIVVALALALALPGAHGCSPAPAPPDSFYRLAADDPGRRYGEPLLAGVVEVERFSADGVIGQRPIVYQDSGPALRQYHYHYWAEAPTRMLQDAFIQALRTANAASQVVTPEMRVRPAYRVIGTLKRLEHLLGHGDSTAAVVLTLEVSVIRTRDGVPMLLETYRLRRPARRAGVPAGIQAFRAAMTEVTARFLDDLAAATRGEASTGPAAAAPARQPAMPPRG